ncbi:SIS domain-containing protein [Opitutus terrae]|uniref:Glutamine--fructose-6-phosphate aminotransferase [isomerizing] n=1 Tax=Opitutus terrae (strain DSM 11246 / JCM 15787 / PB90-1) TaxID=452637 RepID=B1ZRH3_OPITP|nr:SIS domain-containing protein [Opitutus terrae]ACB77623.1 sugar isomerase (SIS) [Opitutus terrae PB90-1]
MKPAVIEGAYLRDLLAQPAAVTATLTALNHGPDLARFRAAFTSGQLQRVVLTGMGSSYTALHPLQLQWVRAGRTVVRVETSELVHHQPGWLTPETLVVAVSQSGASAEIIRLLELNRGRAPVIGVTNTPDSVLARAADACVPLAAGLEATVACKTYVASLVALSWLEFALTAPDRWEDAAAELRDAANAMGDYLVQWREHVGSLAALLGRERATFFLGRGVSLAAADTAGLIMKEAARCPAESSSCAAFRHGPLELLGPATQVVVFAGEALTLELNRRLWRECCAAGAHAWWCGVDSAQPAFRLPAHAAPALPLLEILPVQMMTVALAALGGREAGQFARASKVTTVE